MILPKTTSTAPKALTKANRARILERQRNMCPWCGYGLTDADMHAHHRLLRSAGGTWNLSNIIGLHGHCHNVAAGSVHQEPAIAYGLGLMLRRSQMTPDQIPVYMNFAREWWLLDDKGGHDECNPNLAQELLAAAGNIPASGVIW